MRFERHKSEQGIAIIIVMVSIFALAMLAGAFAYTMKVETKLAANTMYETQMQWAGRAGIDYCRWVLSEELIEPGSGQRYDSLDQAWAGGSGETNETLLSISHENIPVGPGVVINKWKIIDLERKLNINSALSNPQLLHQALTRTSASVTEIPSIVTCVQDWIDPDDQEGRDGAESKYYQGLNPPYYAKNGPIDDVSELLFIKGITPDIYWGGQATNHASSIFGTQIPTRSGFETVQQSDATTGLRDLVSPFSSGNINILTASPEQLQALPGVQDTEAEQIVQLRNDKNGAGMLAYGSPAELLSYTQLGQQGSQAVAAYCSFRSPTREIRVEVQVGMAVRTYSAIVHINSAKDIPVLSLRWKDGPHIDDFDDEPPPKD